MTSPLVSVIIPNYNYADFVGEAIESALSQTYPNIEVIVVDDGSKDQSAEVIGSFDGKIKFIHQQNAGVSNARNRGVAESSGELIAFLDSDDSWLPEKLEKQVKVFERDSDIGLVHCGYVETGVKNGTGKVHLDGMEGNVATELLKYQKPVVLGGGSAVVVRREVFDRVGGFDPEVSPAEDWEFYYRCARVCKVGFVPEVLMEYREHDSNAHLNISRMERAILRAFDKAFDTSEPAIQNIRNECYGKIHSVLAGSYFEAGDYRSAVRHGLRSISYSPMISFRYLTFPLRRARRYFGTA